MKKMIFLMLTLFFLGAASMNAQVTIGSESNPNPSAVLDLQTSNQGLLLPRVALISTTSYVPLKAHVAGMTVYNVAVAGSGATAVTPGLYTNDGSKWIRMAEGASVAVAGAPVIATQPAAFTFSRLKDANGDPTGPASFSKTLFVTATGDAPLKYQWYQKPKNTNDAGTAISSATSASYNVDITAAGIADWGMYSYYCVVSNAQGSVTSEIAEIALGCGAKTRYGEWLSFMCYNLGADPNKSIEEQMAYATTSNTDATVLGDLYQWGRNTDGHEKRSSAGTTTLATNILATEPAEVRGKFVAPGTIRSWVTGYEDVKLWSDDAKTQNDPCPAGWRIPDPETIWSIFRGVGEALYIPQTYSNRIAYFTGNTVGLTFSTSGVTTLFLPAGTSREWVNGLIREVDDHKYHLSRRANPLDGGYFRFQANQVTTYASERQTEGRSVRCVAE